MKLMKTRLFLNGKDINDLDDSTFKSDYNKESEGCTFTFTIDTKKMQENYDKLMEDFDKYGSYILVNDKGEILKFDDE